MAILKSGASAVCGLLLSAGASAEYSGMWKGAMYNAAPPGWPQSCLFIAWTEYVVELIAQPGDGKRFSGGMIQSVTFTTIPREECKMAGAANPFVVGQIKNWTLEGQLRPDGTMEVVAHSGKCREQYCETSAYPAFFKPGAKDFDTVFRLREDTLVDDLGTAEPSDDIVLVTRDAYDSASRKPAASMRTAVKELLTGKCEAFARRAVPEYVAEHLEEGIRSCEQLQASIGKVRRHSDLASIFLPNRVGAQGSDSWLVQYSVVSEKGLGTLMMYLVPRDGEFRIWQWLLR